MAHKRHKHKPRRKIRNLEKLRLRKKGRKIAERASGIPAFIVIQYHPVSKAEKRSLFKFAVRSGQTIRQAHLNVQKIVASRFETDRQASLGSKRKRA